MPFPAVHDYDPSDQTLAAIGRAIIAWNKLEIAMEEAIWRAYGMTANAGAQVGPPGKIVTSFLGFKQKLSIIRSLVAEVLGAAKLKSLKDLFSDLTDLEIDRNVISHGHWFAFNPKGDPYHVKAFKKTLRAYQYYDVTPAEFAKFGERCEKVRKQVSELPLTPPL
jgi:hypothetical protein